MPATCRLLAAGLTTVMLLAAARAEACICYVMQEPPSLEEKLLEAEVVFVGRALYWETDEVGYEEIRVFRNGGFETIRLPPARALAEVDVEQVLKGPLAATTTVGVDPRDGSCGNTLEPGITHLVFASMYEGHLVTNICLSSRLEHAVDDYLRLLEMTGVEQAPYRLAGAPRLGWPPGPTCAASGQPAGRGRAASVALGALLAAALLCAARWRRAI